MGRVAALVLAGVVGGGCGSDEGVGLRLVSAEVREGETPRVVIEVFVTESCYFAVLLNGNLRAAGRWASGQHPVLIPGYLLRAQDNVVRIDVAGDDGSAATLEERIEFCETGAILCGDVITDAGPDGGAPDAGAPDAGGPHETLCLPCDDDPVCGGLPNECVFMWVDELGNEWGVCGTYCGADFRCPAGFVCTQFQDATHTSLLCFPPAPDYACP